MDGRRLPMSIQATAGELYRSWQMYSETVGEKAVSQKRFGEMLGGTGFIRGRTEKGWHYTGIRLIPPPPMPVGLGA